MWIFLFHYFFGAGVRRFIARKLVYFNSSPLHFFTNWTPTIQKKSKLFREKIRGRTIFHLLLKKNQIWSMILFVDNFLELLNFRHLWGQRNHSRWRWSWSYSRLGYHQWRTEVKRRRAIFESFRWFGKEVSTWRKETQAGIRKSFPLDSPTLFISQCLKTIS